MCSLAGVRHSSSHESFSPFLRRDLSLLQVRAGASTLRSSLTNLSIICLELRSIILDHQCHHWHSVPVPLWSCERLFCYIVYELTPKI